MLFAESSQRGSAANFFCLILLRIFQAKQLINVKIDMAVKPYRFFLVNIASKEK